jgi:predicted RNase H-like nuclease
LVVPLVAGVDACKKGWVSILLEPSGFAGSAFASTYSDLQQSLREAQAVAIDIPIGIPENTGGRAADIAARAFVGPRRNSVFLTPSRKALEAETYKDARVIQPSLSAQSFALGKKILEIDDAVKTDDRIFEIHPEVSFVGLADGDWLENPKSTWNGIMERWSLIRRSGIDVPRQLAADKAGPDDVLDAAAAAWSAMRKLLGRAQTLPAVPPIENGRVVAIWY